MMEYVGNFITRATETENYQGRLNDDKSVVQIIHIAMPQTPETNPHTPTQQGISQEKTSTSLREKAKIMNIPWITFLRHEKKASQNGLDLKLGADGVLWPSVGPRERWNKI